MSHNFKSTTSKVITALVLAVFVLATLPVAPAAAATDTFTTPGTSTWTVPQGVTSITVEVWGGGGRGGSAASGNNEVAGGGGGGGAYSKVILTVTPGTVYSYTVGAGSSTTSAGGDSSFFLGATTHALAKGGSSAADNSTTGANGGALSSGIGNPKYSGGNGASGSTTSNRGGGGGSSAGSSANGNDGSSATGGTAPTNGGNGGNARSSSSGVGSSGTIQPGGGGGGAYRSNGSSTTYAGGTGNNGQVKITYTIPSTTIADGTSPASKTVKASDANKAVSAFTLATDAGTYTVTGLTVTGSAGVSNVAASGVKIYRDNGATPNEWDGTDTLIGTGSFSGTTAALTGLTISVTTTPAQYLITYTIGASPVNGATMTGYISAATVIGAGMITNNDNVDATLTVDSLVPTVSAIDRVESNPVGTGTVHWTVTFSESVTGVDAADFALVKTGTLAGESITGVTGTGPYTVAVNTGTGHGTLGLDLAAVPTIQDLAGNSLTDGFTGQVYSVLMASTTTLVSDKNPATYGESVAFTATVTTGATGNVEFYEGTTLIGTQALGGGDPNIAVLNTSDLNASVSAYSITAKYISDGSYAGSTSSPVLQVVNLKTLTITGLSADDRLYNGDVNIALTGTPVLNGKVDGDDVTLGGTPVAQIADKNVGSNRPVTVSGFTISGDDISNYTLVQPTGLHATILQATVTPHVTVLDKIYDGTTAATINTRTLTGVLGTDVVTLTGGTANFQTAAIGSNKTVNITGLSITGGDSGNYLISSTSAATTATITGSISGNAGLAGVTLSYTDGTAKTATSTAGGAYVLAVSPNWSGIVTPSLSGYTFSPTSRTYSNVMSNISGENYTPAAIPVHITGNAGVSYAVMNFTGGSPVTADISGVYSLTVPFNWSGTVTPVLAGHSFTPVSRTYTNLTGDSTAQNYSAIVSSVIYYVDKTSSLGTCSDTLNDGRTPTHPFCTISRASDLASPGNTINVMAGTYAEKIRPLNSGTAGNPITYSAGTGVTITGSHDGTGSDSAFRFTSKSYVVIQGFIVTDTVDEGIYLFGCDHISVLNNSVTSAGSPSGTLSRTGIYIYNTTDSTINGNTTYLNSSHGIDVEGTSTNVVISNNTSYGNAYEAGRIANGIMIQGSSTNITVVHNTLYNNEDTGIGLNGTSHDNFIIGNLSYGNGDHGIDVSGSKNNRVVGNTISGNVTVGINLEGTDDTHNASGSTVQNNISVNNGINPPSGLPGNIRVDTLSITGTTVDYNVVYQSGGSTYVQYVWGTTQHFSLAAFQLASGQEVHGYQANPLLVAPAAPATRPVSGGHPTIAVGDYHITSASPAIDSANSSAPGETADDIEGTARVDVDTTANTGAGTRLYDDRGAYEYHKLSQTISFTSTAPANATVGVGSYTPAATATSGLTVAFTIDGASSSVCSISAGVVSFSGIGTCTINANQPGNANYNAAPQVQQSFAVKSNQVVSFTSTAPTNAAVGGPTYTPTATSTSGLTVVLTIDASSSSVCTLTTGIVSFNNVGTCTINANQPGNASYNAATQVQQSITVKRNQTISFTSTAPADATVGGVTYTPAATATSSLAVAFTIDSSATSFCSISAGEVSFTGIGTCVINANQPGDASYYAAPQVQQSFTVRATTTTALASDKPAPVYTESVQFTATVTSGATGNVNFYNGAALIGTAALNGSTPNVAVLNYAGLDAAGSPHSITAQYVGDAHYFGSTSTALSQVVNPKPITITPNDGQTKVFGTVADPTFTYIPTPALEAGGSFTGALGRATGENVGDYNFTLATLSAGANYSLTLASGHHFSITPKPITITPNDEQSKVFGTVADPTFTYIPTPALEAGGSFTGALGRATGENVGDYNFTLATLSAGANYSLTLASGHHFSITPKPITITPNDEQSKVFGTVADPTFTYIPTPALEAGGSFTGALGRATGENVGDYNFTLATLSAGANYSLTLASGHHFSITPKAVTIIPDVGQTKVFGVTNPPVYTYSSTGLLGTDDVTGAMSRDTGENVGSYAFTLGTLTAGSNYTLAFTASPATFSITPKPITITPTAGQTKVFGTADPLPFGYGHSNLIGTDTISGTLSRLAGENVANYAFDVSTLTAGANYQMVLAVGAPTFSITPRSITITPTVGQTKVFGEPDPVLTYAHTALLDSDTISGVLGRNAGENVATYAYTLGTLNAGVNYTLVMTLTPSTFSITKADQVITFTSTAPSAAVVDGPTYLATATGGGSGSPVVLTIDASSTLVCSISSGTVSFHTVGTCKVNANQAGSSNYFDAAQEQQSFTVGKGAQAITFTSTIPTNAIIGGTYTPTATGGASGNPVVFTIDAASTSICSISTGVVTFNHDGDCVIDANQAANANYNAAPQQQQIIGVGKISQTIVFTSTAPSDAVVDGPTYTPTATGGASGNPVVFTIDTGSASVCTLSAGHVSFIGFGTCTINANQAGGDDYSPAAQVQQLVSVGKGSQQIVFTSTPPSDANVLGLTYDPAATGGASGNPVVFSIDATASTVCSLSTGHVSFIGVGTCTINANQSGSANYNAAAQAQQSFGVVAHINRAPAFTETGPVSVTMTINGSPTPFGLTLHASDFEDDTITWNISVAASHGTADVSGTGLSKAITYNPTHNYAGDDSFTVHITDGNGGNASIVVNVHITSVGATYYIYLPIIIR